MSHIVLRKRASGYQMYDKRKEHYVGSVIKDYQKARKTARARDEREDKKYRS